jgi:putative flippase GtrA
LNSGTTIDSPETGPSTAGSGEGTRSEFGATITRPFDLIDIHSAIVDTCRPLEALGGTRRACYASTMMMPSHPSGRIRALADAVLARFALIRKAGTFALIGVVNTAVDFGVFATAYKVFGLPLVPANLLSWIIAVSCSYVLNSSITFAAESGRKLRLRSYAAFVASGIAGLIGNTTMLWFASYFVPVLVAKVMAIGVSFLLNFSLSHFVVFRPRTTEDGRQRTEERPIA